MSRTIQEINNVLALRDEYKSYGKIAKIVNLPRCTVRDILIRYENEEYPIIDSSIEYLVAYFKNNKLDTTNDIVKTIQITKGYEVVLDAQVYDLCVKYPWYAQTNKTNVYAAYKFSKGHYLMHRIIMNCPDDMQVDHINGNGLDNRFCNLRICTKQQNSYNISKNKNKQFSSQYKGVSFQKNKWRAYIKKDKKQIFLGYYNTELEASNAYKEKAKQMHGEFYRE